MPISSFKVSLTFRNVQALTEMADRVEHVKPLWDAIIDRWISHNKAKFEESRGAQVGGVVFDIEGDVAIWKPLTPDYETAKLAAGFPDWLMVRTGELMRSMTERGTFGWYEEVDDLSAKFGSILPQAFYHRETRPVHFLDSEDRQMVGDMVHAWTSGEPPYKPFRPPDTQRMDAEFKSMIRMS